MTVSIIDNNMLFFIYFFIIGVVECYKTEFEKQTYHCEVKTLNCISMKVAQTRQNY
jgi:hypothetical protein